MYQVVRAFYDSKNKNHLYEVGDGYPVEGYKPTKKRIEELVNGTSKNGKVYLEEVAEDEDDSPDGQTGDENS